LVLLEDVNMNETSIKQESKELTPKSKLSRFSRPLLGAFVGFLFFLLIAILSRNTNGPIILLFPGYLLTAVIMLTNNSLASHAAPYKMAVFIMSSLPSIIIGSLIFAKRQTTRTTGFILLGIYVSILLIIGMIIYASWA